MTNAFKIYFSFKGRVNRKEYLKYSLPYIFAFSLLMMIFIKTTGAMFLEEHIFKVQSMTFILCYPIFPLTIKRLHDMNKSAWSYFAILIPIYNYYWFYKLCAGKSVDDGNKYNLS